MVTLTDLGFCQNMIYEAIICTFNSDGYPNAAPMGVTMIDPCKVALSIFNSANTLKNLQKTKAATLNLTDNIDIYYNSALKNEKMSTDLFEKSDRVNAPKLKTCNESIGLSVEKIEVIDTLRTSVVGNVEYIETLKSYPQAYCRAKPAALEAIIHATRVKALINVEAERVYVAKLCSLIQNCIETVNRSAPNSHYAKLMSDLQEKINTWRDNH